MNRHEQAKRAAYGMPPGLHYGPEGHGTARPRAVDSARTQQVIVTEALRGHGKDGDLCRVVTQYWSLEGELLAENDPINELSD